MVDRLEGTEIRQSWQRSSNFDKRGGKMGRESTETDC